MDSYTEAAYAYTGAKVAFAIQANYRPLAALWGYLTNSGCYAKYIAAEEAFNAAHANVRSNTKRHT
jgi:hypothetical protein